MQAGQQAREPQQRHPGMSWSTTISLECANPERNAASQLVRFFLLLLVVSGIAKARAHFASLWNTT
jgi:hypothetical protein